MKSTDTATLVPFTLPDVEQQSSAIIAAARQEADAIRAAARNEGREIGYAEGVEQGRIAGDQAVAHERAPQLEEALELLRSAADELHAAREQLAKDHTHRAVTLAAAIARRVTKREAAIDPAVLEANITAAMTLIVDRGEIRIVVHPSQRAALAEALPQLDLESTKSKIELTDDPEISPGGCKVFTRGGLVDADLDTQLDRIICELLPEAT